MSLSTPLARSVRLGGAPPPGIGAPELDDLARGAALLGSGGGGDPQLLSAPLAAAMGGVAIPLREAVTLSSDALVAPVVILGSVMVWRERLLAGTEIRDAFGALRRWIGDMPTAVIPLEIGGINALIGLAAAFELGLDLLDADLAGRALPRLGDFTPAVEGLAATPCVMAEPGGRVVLVDGADTGAAEAGLRAHVAGTGGWGLLVTAPLTGAEISRVAIRGSYTRALRLGAVLRCHGEEGGQVLANALDARLIGEGRVTDVVRAAGTADARVSVVVRRGVGPVTRVEAGSEYLAAQVDGRTVATCPDVIAILDARTAVVLAPSRIRVGNDVVVLALDAAPWWHDSPARRAASGPRAFGLDIDRLETSAGPAG